MIKFFFNRFASMVLVVEALGILFMAAAAVRFIIGGAGAPTVVLFVVVIALYAFIRYCASVRWHKDAPRWSGIELQFKKAMVATSYILAIAGILIPLTPPALPLAVAAVLLAAVAHVNVILFYLRRKDRDPMPANYFSGGAFLKK